MKKKIFIYVLCVAIIFVVSMATILDFRHENKELDSITVAEVAHTVFYAPMYVAYEKGYFEEEG